MTDDHLRYAREIANWKAKFAFCRDDIGPIVASWNAKSLKALPPPTAEMSEEQISEAYEQKRIRWHKEIVPDLRTTRTPETIPYFRWSTDKQQYSIEYQRSIFQRYFVRRQRQMNMPPVSAFEFADPETSGKHRFFERRHGGQFAKYVRPGDHAVFSYFDRVGRDALDMLQTVKVLVKVNVFVHLIDHPSFSFCDPTHPNTIRDLQQHASSAEYERRMTSFRVRNTLKAGLAEGRALGNIGDFCYKKIPNPKHIPGIEDNVTNPRFLVEFCPHDAAVCDEMYRLWLEGWTAYEISNALRRKNIRRRALKNQKWTGWAIRRVIAKLHDQRSSLSSVMEMV